MFFAFLFFLIQEKGKVVNDVERREMRMESSSRSAPRPEVPRPEVPRPVPPIPPIRIEIGGGLDSREGFVNAIRIFILLTILSLAPSILIMMTSFTRIVISLFFLRQALGLVQIPPNQVLISLALFLTFFLMKPVFERAYLDALKPYSEGKISDEEFLLRGFDPFRKFMLAQVGEKELALFVKVSNTPRPKNADDIPFYVLIPAFILSEIKKAFEIGFLVYLPFLIIDIVISSVLMSMGMLMVPPILLSLPFKIIVFVLADGWNIFVNSLVKSFNI